MPAITLKLKNKSLGDYKLQAGFSLTIGRRKNNDVVIEDLAVSGYHAKIDSLGDRHVLIDLQSKNGSFVNEQLINSHWLKHGDVINIGGHSIVFNHYAGEPKINSDLDEFYLDYLGGLPRPKINDTTVTQSTILHDLDIIDIGAARLQFSNKFPEASSE